MKNKFYKLVEIPTVDVSEHKGAFVLISDDPLQTSVCGALNKIDFALHLQEGTAIVCNLDKLIEQKSI